MMVQSATNRKHYKNIMKPAGTPKKRVIVSFMMTRSYSVTALTLEKRRKPDTNGTLHRFYT